MKLDDPKVQDATAEFARRYPQVFSAVWRVEPYATIGDVLPVAAGMVVEKTSKDLAVAALIKAMAQTQDTETHTLGHTERVVSLCKEGVFVLLLRSMLLLQHKDDDQVVNVHDCTIEGVYRFRDGVWRHIWGLNFFPAGT